MDLSITATALFAPVTLVVPRGVDIDVTSGARIRDRRTNISNVGPSEGALRVRLRAISILADVILID